MNLRRLLIACVLVMTLAPLAGAQQKPEQQEEFVPMSELPPQEQLPSQPLVIGAYAFAWLVIGGYVLSLARRVTAVQRELERLEADARRGR